MCRLVLAGEGGGVGTADKGSKRRRRATERYQTSLDQENLFD